MANTDRYIMGLVENLQNLTGTLSEPLTINGYLSNATLRGIPIELRIQDGTSILQWKYLDENEWQDLIELNNLNYEELINKPTINDITIIGNLTPADLGLSTRAEGVATISRSGLTYTVTRPDGSTFSFDQLDQENVIESVSVNGTQLAVNNKNVNVTVPTAVSELTNDENYATQSYVDSGIDSIAAAMPTKVSDLTNDSNFTTQTYVDTELEKKQDTLPMGEVTSADIGKALMPKTVSNGEVTSWEFGEAGMVDDVTINGTSIVNNKVAEIPVATSSDFGVVKVDTYASGYQGGIATLDGKLYAIGTNLSNIKNGIDLSKLIAAGNQHQAVFYGLAKAAGSDEKNSTLSFGTYTSEAKSAIQTMLGVPAVDDVVTDVQVNGTSITADGVANIPIASNSNFGVVKVYYPYGIAVNNNNQLTTQPAENGEVKAGFNVWKPIIPYRQHMATFYGLAKAAGHDEKDSTLSVGTYTDAAKTAIQSMLGIDTAIANAVGQITGFDFSVVQELPVSGVKGIIYLVAHSHGDNDGYDEYIWINDGFEKLGHCDIDLSNYVTFDDYATANKAGVVKINGLGLTMIADGRLCIVKATDSELKGGTNNYDAVVPSKQHMSTFYGLAKAAGDSTQSASANAVGTYTDDAKSAIQTMLGVPSADQVVTDVQINETSIVTNGVAEIPIADGGTYGVVKVSEGVAYGITKHANGVIETAPVGSIEIKAGSNGARPLTSSKQHEATFYGLAKAAGHDEKDSTEPLGTYTAEAKTAIQSMLGVPADDEVVKDVQINGTSIVSNGAANIPIAGENKPGVVGINSGYGININSGQPGKYLYINPASDNEVKQGVASYKPLCPFKQHSATFYGLAKAAGDTTMASSSNAVGTYTDTAKTAIKNMLGVNDGIEVVRLV